MAVDVADPGPYVGPEPFTAKHRSAFFGRVGELQQLRTMVLSNPVVLVYAGSGAGKTSLLNAGLVPQLQESDDFEALPVARVTGPATEDASGDGANPYVRGVLASWLGEADLDREAGALTLPEFLRRRPHPDAPDGWSAPRLVVIDQLEEVFTLRPHHWRQRDEFFAQLGEAVADDPLLRVILAIREDYTYEIEPQRVRLPGRLKARFRLELLREPAALEAVVRPLEPTGRAFEPGVAERLVRNLRAAPEVEADGAEPLFAEFVEPVQLQVTCAALWQALPPDRKAITAEDVRSFGDVDQALRALYDSAIAVAAREAGVEEKRLRLDFAKAFITSLDTRNTAYLSDDGVADMPWTAIKVLERQHVIRAEWRSQAHWYELTHDRFIAPIRQSNRRFVLRDVTGLRGRDRAVPMVMERRGGLTRLGGRRREPEPSAPPRPGAREDERVEHGVALCLTGGGFRSMLFTSGVLWRLNDAGWLPRLQQISSNSTAAVAAGVLGLGWERLELDENGRSGRFEEVVVAPLRELAGTTLDTRAWWSSLLRQHTGNEELAAEYGRRLFGPAVLGDLPDRPRFVFTASHLASGELWSFAKDAMGNERTGWIDQPDVTLAVAVAAAGANPPLLSPAVLDGDANVELTSGSLYDTLALETAWRRYDTVLVSDAKGSRPVAHVHRRYLGHFMDFVAAADTELHRLHRQQALLAYTAGMKAGGYWSINSHLASFPLHDALPCSPDDTAELAAVPSRLARLDPRFQERLVNWGYAVSDAALRAHVDRTIAPPSGFPYPEVGVG